MVKSLLKNKITLIILILTAAGLVSAAAYVKFSQPKPVQQTSADPASEAPIIAEKNSTSKTPAPSSPESESPQQTADNQAVKVFISTLAQDSSKVYIGATVSGITSGTCTLTLKQAGQTSIQKTSQVGRVTSYYACGSFDIPKSDFPSKGAWYTQVSLNSGSSSATSEEKSINVE